MLLSGFGEGGGSCAAEGGSCVAVGSLGLSWETVVLMLRSEDCFSMVLPPGGLGAVREGGRARLVVFELLRSFFTSPSFSGEGEEVTSGVFGVVVIVVVVEALKSMCSFSPDGGRWGSFSP